MYIHIYLLKLNNFNNLDLWVYSISGMLHRSPGKGLGFKPTWLQKFTTPKNTLMHWFHWPPIHETPIGQIIHSCIGSTDSNAWDANWSGSTTLLWAAEDGTSGFPTTAGLKQVATGLIAWRKASDPITQTPYPLMKTRSHSI